MPVMYNKPRTVINPDDVIDIHVHMGGPPAECEEMYFWSPVFVHSLAFRSIKLVTRLGEKDLSALRYLHILLNQVQQARNVNKIVLLALDQVYREDGSRDREGTHLFVANEFIAGISALYRQFLFGCSVHPYAPDALERLWQCAKYGAVLCKWIPSSQGIDPTHPLAQSFYRALALLNLPLLLHMGPEEAIPTSLAGQWINLFNAAAGKYGPGAGDALAMASQAGVKVIVAHCAAPLGALLDEHNAYWEKVFDSFLHRLGTAAANRNLYSDISALCLPGRMKYILKILPLVSERPDRFLFGSDYPIPVISFREGSVLHEILDTLGWLAGRALPGNDLDKNYLLLQKKFPGQTFTSAAGVLRQPQAEIPDLTSYLRKLGMIKRRFFFLPDLFQAIIKKNKSGSTES
jgi:predicted TIM-barrel fold metal-dependent hydrolase